ncbi:unnamed protein product [Acanthoscelides obtectus]|uniref:DUF4371 domain-containing protein n=1 Tax=Acanthoscelides obtectus TaxID=200917 RepID=A0A9P0PYX0_ACAOB|nr:unnamed protein product [Acanthoscelides obtectus]CAK1670835.1 Protein ZBED8 [Acanthoscelides obtectus]
MNGICDKCNNPTLEPTDNTDSVKYFQWKSVIEEKIVKGQNKKFKITKKVTISSTVKELEISFIQDIPVMKKHLYGIYKYNKLKKELKENLTEEEILIQIDFSENYTSVYYIRNVDNILQSKSFATVSENLDHQAHAIWAHMKPILRTVLEKKDINALHIYSDGPTSQYRNRTNIHLWLQTLITEFKQITKSSWTYSEPGHGKGPMDGVGGALKRIADRHVLMGRDIQTASDLLNLFTDSTILVKEIPDEDISSAKDLVPKTLDAIPGIMNITRITWQRGPDVTIKLYRHERFEKQLKMSTLSCSLYPKFEPINMGILSRKSPQPNESMDIQDLQKSKKRSIYKNIYYSSSSDDDDLMSISVRQQTAQKSVTVEAGTSYIEGKENLHPNLISPGTFVLIRVPTQNKTVNYRYVATCKTGVDKDDGEILVTYLKSKRPTLDRMFASTSQRNNNGLRASYNSSLLIAKSGKPHTIGEKLILPAVEEVLKTVLHKPASDIIKRIPLSNNAVERRIDEMSSDIESFLCNYLQTTHFSIQLDESTLPDNAALLLAYVRFIMNQEIYEELLFARTLITDTKGESIFHVLKDYFIGKAIPLSNIISVATDGAPAMLQRRGKELAEMISDTKAFIKKLEFWEQN